MKRAVSDWRPKGLNERPGLTATDLEALAQALPAPPSGEAAEAFHERLGGIASWYWLAEAWRDAPPPSEVRKKLESIRSAAQRLAAQLGVPSLPDEDADPLAQLPYPIRNALVSAAGLHGEAIGGYRDHPPTLLRVRGQPEEYPDYHGDSKLGVAIEHVQLIVAWCDFAIRSSRQSEEDGEVERIKRHGSTGRRARNPGNEPLNDMIGRLGNLYRDTSGRPPGIARPRGGKGEPGGPFVRFVLAVCKRMQIPMTAPALEKRWRTISRLVRASGKIEKLIDDKKA